LLNYLAAVGIGGALALFAVTAIVSFFHFVVEERRESIAEVIRARASRMFLRRPRLSSDPP
jgi:hypothetical protein